MVGEGEGGTNGERGRMKTEAWKLTTIWETASQWGFAVRHRELNPMLPANLEQWDGVRQKEVQEGGDVCVPVTDSC